MNILQAAILGLVQGLGEFLPISSSGHLLLSRILMGFTIDETGAYHMLDILLHVGTLIPVLIVFWKDWWAILKNPFKSKTLLLLFIASLPTLLFKVVFDDFITSCETGWFLGASFLLTGFFPPAGGNAERTPQAVRRPAELQSTPSSWAVCRAWRCCRAFPAAARRWRAVFSRSEPQERGEVLLHDERPRDCRRTHHRRQNRNRRGLGAGFGARADAGGHPRGGSQRLYRHPLHAQPHQPCQA